MRGSLLAAALATAALTVVSASLARGDQRVGSGLITFRTPSKNIACGYLARSSFTRGGYLRCDVLSGIRPKPRRRCELDWTGYSVATTGKAHAVCAGDTVNDIHARILRYGRAWRRGGITCLSRKVGLRCVNRSGHGFFLSRQRSYAF